MDYNHKINIIKMNKLSAVLLLYSNMCFKNVIKSGKHLKSVKSRFCLYGHCFFSTIIIAVHFFSSVHVEKHSVYEIAYIRNKKLLHIYKKNTI